MTHLTEDAVEVSQPVFVSAGQKTGQTLDRANYSPQAFLVDNMVVDAAVWLDERTLQGTTIQGAEEVWILNTQGNRVTTAVPDASGTWSAALGPGDYYVVAVAPTAGCQPLIHGPITVT